MDRVVLNQFIAIDLTHALDPAIPSWTGRCGFSQEIKMDYHQGCRVLSYKCHAGIGTHIDAPSHFFPDGMHVADIALSDLIVPACVIDVSQRRSQDLFVLPEDILHFEKKHGMIPEKSLVFAYTGWEAFWSDVEAYRNPDSSGKMRFPGFSPESAALLLKRGIVGIGIDTLSPDGSTQGFPVHEQVLGAGKYILENVANLSQMPPIGGFAINLPIKVKTGTEAAVRLVGLYPA